MAGIDLDFEVHAVLDQQDTGRRVRGTGITHKAGFVFQASGFTILQFDDQLATFNRWPGRIPVTRRANGAELSSRLRGELDDPGTANRVVARPALPGAPSSRCTIVP